DLKTVAGSEHQAAARGELGKRVDDRRAPGDRASPEVVAVGEATWEDQAVEVGEVGVAVPDVAHRLGQDFAGCVGKHAVTPRAREEHHAEVHGTLCSPLWWLH